MYRYSQLPKRSFPGTLDIPKPGNVTLKRVMNKALFVSVLSVSVLATALAPTVSAQGTREFLGRWDVTVTPAAGKSYPQWMELTDNGGKIEGRVQPRGGAWHPITDAQDGVGQTDRGGAGSKLWSGDELGAHLP